MPLQKVKFAVAEAQSKMKPIRSLFITIFVLAKILVVTTGCANVIPPTGGPRDTLPPVLVTVVPLDSTLNFKTNKIVFNFDEYLELKDVRTNLIVSPVPKTNPIVTSKLRTITVILKDTLKPFTTYTLDFGKAIHDINEGNILKNFTYIFSTGPYLDSMELTGTVILASTGKPDSTLMAILHKGTDDSAVIKERPRYIARLDSLGRFHFRHIAPGTYAVYALKDESGTNRYSSKSQLFAFSDTSILVLNNNPPLTLYAFSDTTGSLPTKKAVVASKPKKTDNTNNRLIITVNVSEGRFDLLDTFHIQSQVPLRSFDSTKIRFTDGDFKTIPNAYFVEDSDHKKITLQYKWPPDTKYHVIADKSFAEDTTGKKLLKIDTISFLTKKENEYGTLILHFRNYVPAKNPVLQFVQNNQVVKTLVITTPNYTYKLFRPGDYELRVLFDENKNGVWDPGDFFGKHKQPEKVKVISRKLLRVKSNWDNENDVFL
jgi:uncharacterized protein (DUF2141 family)